MKRGDKIVTRRRCHGVWLSTCAMATALAVAPHTARAQAFQGTPTVVTGSATIATGTNTTGITAGTAETVINWTPFDTGGSGTIDFLPAGTTASFRAAADFTVLNRILPVDTSGGASARMVGLNGTVSSVIGLRAPVTGGNVWFYTPTGLVIGPTATMNVGGLVLTTDDIQFTPNPPGAFGSIYGPGGVIQFRGPAGSTGLIDVQAGAQLNAVGTTSYIAMVAPRIQQAGTVSAERSVGYIAAEQADLTINAGLFNISILAGTTDPNGIVHTGTTTGSASTSGADIKTISFVALPKTTALTMLLSGSIGYAPAVDAFNDGSAVVLSSGYTAPQPTAEAAGSLGDISIDNASFTSPLAAYASGSLDITAAGGPVALGSFANLYAQDALNITLGAGEQFSSSGYGLSLSAGRAATGGSVDISLGSKAVFSVAGYVDIYASNSYAPFALASAPIAKGGQVTIDADGGSFTATNLFADAEGTGQFDPAIAAPAIGGTISLTARNGGSITATSFDASADAYGGNTDTVGGDATGGSISLIGQNGGLNLGSVFLDASSFASYGSVNSGAATGGTTTISLSGGTYNWDSLAAYTTASAGYTAGSQGNSAAVAANALTLTLDNNATLNVAKDINLDASALATVDGAAGTNAQAGGVTIDVDTGSSLNFTSLFAFAEGGIRPPDLFDPITPTSTPDVTGGTINFTAAGQVTGSSINLLADAAEFGASSTSGTARGGTIDMLVNNGGNVALDDGDGTASLDLDAEGLGAVGASPANAIGGSATLSLADGTVNVAGTVTVDASAQWHQESFFYPSGPDPLTGFNAEGGLATVELLPGVAGTSSLTASSLIVNALGDASTPPFNFVPRLDGDPPAGTYGGPMSANGGDGTGGTATLSVAAGALNLSAGGALVEATGQGGISDGSTLGTAFQSGNGFGGIAHVGVTGGTSTLGYLAVEGFGVGGGGAVAGGVGELPALAGFGLGGGAQLSVGGGTLSAASLTLDATGTGGDGGGSDADQAGTNGGDGLGGSAYLISPAGATGQLTSANVLILGGGAGGAGGFGTTQGNGGNGTGGAAGTNLADGAFALGAVTLGADGDGGSGVIGGRGTGGSSNFKMADSSGPSGPRTIGSLSLYANGIGGTGGSGTGASDAGSTGLDVEAFDATSGLSITGDLLADAEGSNSPVGQGFTALIGAAPLTVGGNSSITTTRDAVVSGTSQFHTTGDLTITARSLSASAPLAADGNVAIDAQNGVSLGSLTSGGTTGLTASNGAITAADLRSAGLVTATGQSLLIESGAGLTFANATATAGDLKIVTTGGLTSNGPVTATGNVALIGTGGLSAGTVTSGGTTTLNAANGAITVTDLHSPGLVTASGQAVDIASPQALTFGETSATAGDLTLTALDLAATGPLFASGNVALDATNGIALGALTAGGTTDLTATNGAISATDLRSDGSVAVSGRSIDIASGGGLTFASANATAGDLAISTALGLTATGPLAATGNVALSGGHGISAGTVTSGGTTSLTAANGAIAVSDLQSPGSVSASGESINLVSSGPLTFSGAEATSGDLSLTALHLTATGPLSATGNVALDGANGIAIGSLTSGGTTGLTSNGAINITNLNSAGLVTAAGRSVNIASSAALSFADAQATGGDLAVVTLGNLALATGSASGNLDLESDSGAITGTGTLSSGGNAFLSGQLGVSTQTLSSGGTTTVESDSGPVSVADLTSSGSVTANGTAVDIGSSGGLTFAAADATSGDLTIATGGDLSLPTATATGAMALTSGGTITSNSLTAGGNFSASGAMGVDLTAVQSGGTTSLSSLGFPSRRIAPGDVTVTDLTSAGDVSATGRAVTIGSTGALSFAGAEATGGNLLIAALDLRATGLLSATGNVDLDAANGIALGSLTSGGTTTLTSDGAISATDLRSAGLVSANGGSVDLASGAGLSFGTLQANAGDLSVSTVDDLVLDTASATGALNLASSGGAITASDALSGGGNVSVIGLGGVALPSLTSGGTTLLRSSGGALSVDSLTSAGLISAGGRSVDIASPGALSFTQANATAGNLTISTAGNLALRNASVSGSAALASNGGAVTSTGAIRSGSAFSATALTGLDFAALDSGGTTGLTSDGSISVGDLRSAGLVTATGGSVDIASGGGLSFGDLQASAGDLNVSTVDDLVLDTASAAGALNLASSGGSIDATGALSGGGNVSVIGANGITLPSLTSGGTTLLRSDGGAVSVDSLTSAGLVTASGRSLAIHSPGALSFTSAKATAGGLSIGTAGRLLLASATATGPVALTASGGAVAVDDLVTPGLVTAQGGSVTIGSSGGLSFAAVSANAGDVSISTEGDLSSGLVSATGELSLNSANGDVHALDDVEGADIFLSAGGAVQADSGLDATGVLQINAGGTFGLGGTAAASSITVSSADIDLAPGSQLGSRGVTQSITLVPDDPTAPLFVGGSGQAGSYSLDSAEAQRLFADGSIFIGSTAGEGLGTGDVTLGDLALSYGSEGNLGTGGQLGIFTGGNVTVNGAVQLTTSSADDTFAIDPALIDVVAGQGSIAMQSDAGAPQGTLSLTADRIVVATPATFDAIDGLTDLAQISQALDKPGAAGPDGGYLQAGRIEANIRDAFLVQNGGASDAYADRRGFTANELDINTDSAATQIAINGTIQQGGKSVTGLDTAPLVTINEQPATAGGQLDPLSTINGCAIGADCTPPPPPPPSEEPLVTNPTEDDLTKPGSTPDRGNQVFTDQLFSLADNAPLITPPLVDEPITGVGNDDLWVTGCDGGTDQACSQKKEGGE